MSAQTQLEAVLDVTGTPTVGDVLTVRIRANNSGDDCDSELHVIVRCDEALLLLAAVPWLRGDPCGRELALVIPPLLRGERFEFVVHALALRGGEARIVVNDGELRCTIDAAPAFSRNANRLDATETHAQPGSLVRGRVAVTNTGAASAICELRVDGDLEEVHLECEPILELAAGARRIIAFEGRVSSHEEDGAQVDVRAVLVGRTGETVLGEETIVVRSSARFEGTIETSPHRASVAAGDRIAWRVELANVGRAAADALTIALQASGSVYVPGTTALDGLRLIDCGGTSVLWTPAGLRLERFPAGHTAALTCETLVEPGTSAAALCARVMHEECELLLQSAPVAVAEARLGGANLAFTVCDPVFAVQAGNGYRRSERAALEPAAARHLDGTPGLARHLWALAALCADACDDAEAAARLSPLRTALRSVFDRLCIKLRIPQYELCAEDVLDGAATNALTRAVDVDETTLAGRLGCATRLVAARGDGDVSIALYREALARRFASFPDDGALIDALTTSDAALDELLDAVIAYETSRSSA